MQEQQADLLTRLSIPIGVLTTIIGGSAWLTTTHNRVEQVAYELGDLRTEYRVGRDKFAAKLEQQDDNLSEISAKISGFEVKIDILISEMKRHNR